MDGVRFSSLWYPSRNPRIFLVFFDGILLTRVFILKYLPIIGSRDGCNAQDSRIANTITASDRWFRYQTQNANLADVAIAIAHPDIPLDAKRRGGTSELETSSGFPDRHRYHKLRDLAAFQGTCQLLLRLREGFLPLSSFVWFGEQNRHVLDTTPMEKKILFIIHNYYNMAYYSRRIQH